MNPSQPEAAAAQRSSELLGVMRALSAQAPGALDSTAALALRAQTDGQAALAAGAAGLVVLVEHLQACIYRHAMPMLGVLTAVGPDAVGTGIEGLLAWAGASIAHDYGVLPAWPPANVALLMESARQAPSDVSLALACALGELCERHGEDAEFELLFAQVATVEKRPDASPFWRGHWAIVAAWHLYAFAKVDEARERLVLAQQLAAEHHLPGLAAVAALQRARLVECSSDPTAALALAAQAAAAGDAASTPLWWADQADVRCRVALLEGDFHAALGHARRALGHLQMSGAWPGYQVTYLVQEGYALIGCGNAEDAAARFQGLGEMQLPRYLAARLRCLADLTALIAIGQRNGWGALPNAPLARAMRTLRELEWPGVLPLLPLHIGEIFCQALVQGAETDWVRSAIRTRRLAAPAGAPEAWPWSVKVHALGGFEMCNDAGAVRSAEGRKAASKPLELLRYLACRGTEAASTEAVARELWPGDGREGRQKAFEVTVARLRRLLAHDAALLVQDHGVRLNADCVWVDVQALNDRLTEHEHSPAGSSAAAGALDAALKLYRGPCLTLSEQTWALAAAERWRARLAAALLREARDASVDATQAREWTLRAVSADPGISSHVAAPATHHL
ncbi:AfsR/SARP family transcriptional regulator [Roseateles sp. P5_D6]